MILEDDGGVFEASIAATSLALADARLPMFDLVAAVNIVSETVISAL
jgi:ribonuclease PH